VTQPTSLDQSPTPTPQPPRKPMGGMGWMMLACAAMCGLPIIIASASVLATPLLGPAALVVGAVAVTVVLRRRGRATCATMPSPERPVDG
jgi:hypothetical protein